MLYRHPCNPCSNPGREKAKEPHLVIKENGPRGHMQTPSPTPLFPLQPSQAHSECLKLKPPSLLTPGLLRGHLLSQLGETSLHTLGHSSQRPGVLPALQLPLPAAGQSQSPVDVTWHRTLTSLTFPRPPLGHVSHQPPDCVPPPSLPLLPFTPLP